MVILPFPRRRVEAGEGVMSDDVGLEVGGVGVR